MERIPGLRRRCLQDPEDISGRASLVAELQRSGALSQESIEAAAYELDPAAIEVVGPSPEREEFERVWEKSNRFHLRLRWFLLAATLLLAGGFFLLMIATDAPCLTAVGGILLPPLLALLVRRRRYCPSCSLRQLRPVEYFCGSMATEVSPDASRLYVCANCRARFQRCGGRWFADPPEEDLEAYEAAVGPIPW